MLQSEKRAGILILCLSVLLSQANCLDLRFNDSNDWGLFNKYLGSLENSLHMENLTSNEKLYRHDVFLKNVKDFDLKDLNLSIGEVGEVGQLDDMGDMADMGDMGDMFSDSQNSNSMDANTSSSDIPTIGPSASPDQNHSPSHSYEKGINKFSFLTETEFQKRYLIANPVMFADTESQRMAEDIQHSFDYFVANVLKAAKQAIDSVKKTLASVKEMGFGSDFGDDMNLDGMMDGIKSDLSSDDLSMDLASTLGDMGFGRRLQNARRNSNYNRNRRGRNPRQNLNNFNQRRQSNSNSNSNSNRQNTRDPLLRNLNPNKTGTFSYKSFKFKRYIDWSIYFNDLKDQGDCNACYVTSSLEVVEAMYQKQFPGKARINLALQEILDCNTETRGCDGGQPSAVLGYMKKNGIMYEKFYQYKAKKGRCQRGGRRLQGKGKGGEEGRTLEGESLGFMGNGISGQDGEDGQDGQDGEDGQDGQDGADGEDDSMNISDEIDSIVDEIAGNNDELDDIMNDDSMEDQRESIDEKRNILRNQINSNAVKITNEMKTVDNEFPDPSHSNEDTQDHDQVKTMLGANNVNSEKLEDINQQHLNSQNIGIKVQKASSLPVLNDLGPKLATNSYYLAPPRRRQSNGPKPSQDERKPPQFNQNKRRNQNNKGYRNNRKHDLQPLNPTQEANSNNQNKQKAVKAIENLTADIRKIVVPGYLQSLPSISKKLEKRYVPFLRMVNQKINSKRMPYLKELQFDYIRQRFYFKISRFEQGTMYKGNRMKSEKMIFENGDGMSYFPGYMILTNIKYFLKKFNIKVPESQKSQTGGNTQNNNQKASNKRRNERNPKQNDELQEIKPIEQQNNQQKNQRNKTGNNR